ncbi:MAG TPA: dolichyl-phosphate beta-glucosyltransferase [Acidimicrobiales bacterium]|nr:dolichyl-phosphate beta-glucosyltransferase [Acidimicrobiales bacterium]
MADQAFRSDSELNEVKLTIVIPAFNEGKRIAIGLDTLVSSMARGELGSQSIEIIVVDDGSTDDTAERARNLLRTVPGSRVIGLVENRGKGAAIRAGVAQARGAVTALMDADMAVHPSQLSLLLTALKETDVAIGSRSLPDSITEADTFFRVVSGRAFTGIVRALIGLPFSDTQCGFKAYRTPVARILFHYSAIDRFAFDVEVLDRAVRLGLRVAEVPVRWVQVGGSRIRPLADPWSMVTDLLRIRSEHQDTQHVHAVVVRSTKGINPTIERARSLLGPTVPIVQWRGDVLVLLPLYGQHEMDNLISGLERCVPSATIVKATFTEAEIERMAPLSFKSGTAVSDVSAP